MEVVLSVLVVAEGLGITQSLLLSLPSRFRVNVLGPVADAGLAREAMKATGKNRVDLVIVELARQDGRAYEIIASLADQGNRVLAVASPCGEDDGARALGSGATGVIRGVGGRPRELVASLRGAAAGMLVLPEEDLSLMVNELRNRSPSARSSIHDLTGREREVLLAMAGGASCAEVARALGISQLTVRSHMKNVMSKLDVHSKVEAVTFALRAGLTDRRTA